MNQFFRSPVLFFALSVFIWAKAPTTKIMVRGAGLPHSIEITNTNLIRSLRIFGGPGFTINGMPDTQPGMADWSRGNLSQPSGQLKQYEIAVYEKSAGDLRDRVMYEISYWYDSGGKQGYIYIPQTPLNMRAVKRGVEGKWFYSSSDFDHALMPLIEKAH